MTRLVVDAARLGGDQLALDPDEAKYLERVLRLRPGDVIEVRDGLGGSYEARLTGPGRLALGEKRALPEPAGARVHLAFAPPKGKRVDVLLEKATEIGACAFHPVTTRRSVRKGGDEARWQRVVRAAAAQCGVAHEPVVHATRGLDGFLANLPDAPLRLIADPAAARPLSSCLDAADAAVILTGPEGGFTPQELSDAQASGFAPFALGPNILRAETAPLVALTIVRHRLGDLG